MRGASYDPWSLIVKILQLLALRRADFTVLYTLHLRKILLSWNPPKKNLKALFHFFSRGMPHAAEARPAPQPVQPVRQLGRSVRPAPDIVERVAPAAVGGRQNLVLGAPAVGPTVHEWPPLLRLVLQPPESLGGRLDSLPVAGPPPREQGREGRKEFNLRSVPIPLNFTKF